MCHFIKFRSFWMNKWNSSNSLYFGTSIIAFKLQFCEFWKKCGNIATVLKANAIPSYFIKFQ